MRPQEGSAATDANAPSCAICLLTRRSVERQVRAFCTEFVNDPTARVRFRQSRGFCPHHTPLLAELGDALAVAILYADLAERTRDRWQTERTRRFPFARQAVRQGAPPASCPACAAETEAEHRYTQALAAGLDRIDGIAWKELEEGTGLCVAHTEGVMAAATLPLAATRLRDLETRRLALLQAELEEIIRKNDYRFRGETWGAERDAWQRALQKLRRPGE
jgi:hypothetical protein